MKTVFVILALVCSALSTDILTYAQPQPEPPDSPAAISARELLRQRALTPQNDPRLAPPEFSPYGNFGNQRNNRITGAFGIKLGEQLPEELRGSDSPTTTDGKFLQFPVTPSVTIAPHLDAIYLVKVTPVEDRVFEIVATCRVEENDYHLTAYELSEQFINILEKRYGKSKGGPVMKEGKVVSVTFEDTSSKHSPRIEILIDNNRGLVTVIYQDPRIEEVGKPNT